MGSWADKTLGSWADKTLGSWADKMLESYKTLGTWADKMLGYWDPGTWGRLSLTYLTLNWWKLADINVHDKFIKINVD